jgi:short-subunit dehydrogenase
MPMKNPTHIFITGASSGIGAALAEAYAAPGIRLSLSARRMEKLNSVAANCRAKGAETDVYALDVEDRAATRQIVETAHQEQPLDLVIANAGISGGTGGGGESETQVREIFDINVTGVLNTALPAAELMTARGKGQIALMSSQAGFRGLATAPAYCGSKAAVRVYGEGLRGQLEPKGVEVSVICPGYVISPMTDANDFPMPWLMPTPKAAGIIINGLARNKGMIAFPRRMNAVIWILKNLPQSAIDMLGRRLPKKS